MSRLIHQELASRACRVVLLAVLAITSPHVLGQPREDGPLRETVLRPPERLPSAPCRSDQRRGRARRHGPPRVRRELQVLADDAGRCDAGDRRGSRGAHAERRLRVAWTDHRGHRRSSVTLSVIENVVVGTLSSSRGASVSRAVLEAIGLHLVERADPQPVPGRSCSRTEVRAQAQSLEDEHAARRTNGQEIDAPRGRHGLDARLAGLAARPR